MNSWALDLGTTNCGVACWDEALGKPRLIELPAVCRKLDAKDPLEAPRLVPSAIHFIEEPGALDRLGSWPPLARRFFIGRRALIGRQALERNDGVVHPSFVPTFKPGLSGEALRPLARVGRESLTARDAAHAYLRELLREIKRETGERVRDIVVTSPVSAFETYRAEVQQGLQKLGVRRVRFVDEPVAAALGYGISLSHPRTVLVVDVGGGTMHVVLVRLAPQGAVSGQATVLAKRGRLLGGNAVDGWVLNDLCRQMGYDLATGDDEITRLWRRLMLAEASRVKEAVFFEDEAAFLMNPGGTSREASRPGSGLVTLNRARLREILDENGFYRSLAASLEEVLEQGRVAANDIEDVLLVGGSTLLPGFFSWFEERFERRRVRAWQPFEAVAYGAACFASDRMDALDFIAHDYAFVTHDPKTGDAQHTIIVPRGTRFPTSPELWKRQLVPTCALGEPESLFKLLICEVSRADADGGDRRFVWDAAGDVHKVGGSSGEAQVVVPLNAASPTLGYLDPPHSPRDRRPRLEIAFGVSSERWLIATVRDLLTQRELMSEEPVVRLV
jgi:molecular chaperone DnaK (HSP70)